MKEKLILALLLNMSIASIIASIIDVPWSGAFLAASVASLALLAISEIVKEKKLDVENLVKLLMVIVGMLTYASKLYLEGSLVLALYFLSELIEIYSLERAEKSLRSLIKLLPRRAKKLINGTVEEVELSELGKGDIAVVGRGERVPADGIVEEGRAEIDQSIITGEPLPVNISKGDLVYAGTLIVSGAIKLRVINAGGESLLSRTLKRAEEYRKKKTRIERKVQTFSKIYLPVMVAIAFLVWAVLSPSTAVIIIAISCPSAFLISIAVTYIYSMSKLLRNGILAKGTPPIEVGAKVKAVVFDKTGTLTLGKPHLVRIETFSENINENRALEIAASIEAASAHPLAKALLEEARRRKLKLCKFRDCEEIPGKGIRGRLDGIEVLLGSKTLMKEYKIRFPAVNGRVTGLKVYMAVDRRPVAVFVFEDEVNPESRKVIKALREAGYAVSMITGDRDENAKAVAEQIGIQEYYSALSPEEKIEFIHHFKSRLKSPIAMVGGRHKRRPSACSCRFRHSCWNGRSRGRVKRRSTIIRQYRQPNNLPKNFKCRFKDSAI